MNAKILVIEDDPSLGELVELQLTNAGHEARLAKLGQQGIDMASASRFDLALVDHGLPDISGSEVAENFKQQDLPFIMLTANSDPQVVTRCSNLGAMAYLVKPVSQAQLIPAVEAAIQRSAEVRALKVSQAEMNQIIERNREISMAIGILMDNLSLREQDAYECLRQKARSERRKAVEVAEELVDASAILNTLLSGYEKITRSIKKD